MMVVGVKGVLWTCCQLYSQLGPHAQRKRRGAPLTLVVAGCVAQQEGRNVSRRFPEVDLVMGPQYTNRSTYSDLTSCYLTSSDLIYSLSEIT